VGAVLITVARPAKKPRKFLTNPSSPHNSYKFFARRHPAAVLSRESRDARSLMLMCAETIWAKRQSTVAAVAAANQRAPRRTDGDEKVQKAATGSPKNELVLARRSARPCLCLRACEQERERER